MSKGLRNCTVEVTPEGRAAAGAPVRLTAKRLREMLGSAEARADNAEFYRDTLLERAETSEAALSVATKPIYAMRSIWALQHYVDFDLIDTVCQVATEPTIAREAARIRAMEEVVEAARALLDDDGAWTFTRTAELSGKIAELDALKESL